MKVRNIHKRLPIKVGTMTQNTKVSHVSKYNRTVAKNGGQEFKQVASTRGRVSQCGLRPAGEQPMQRREEH